MAFRTGAFPGGACRLPRQGPCVVFQTGAFPGKLGLSLVAFASYLCNTHGRCSGLGLSLVASSLVESNILTAICLRFWLIHAVFFDAIPSSPTFQRGMERTQKKTIARMVCLHVSRQRRMIVSPLSFGMHRHRCFLE